MSSTWPALLYRSTAGPSPVATAARFGTVAPAAGLRFEASGRSTPCGHAVTKLSAVPAVAVTLSTAPDAVGATASDRSRVMEAPPTTAPAGTPVPYRVSSKRLGATGVNEAPVPGA